MFWQGHRNFGKVRYFGDVPESLIKAMTGDNTVPDTWAVALWCKVGSHPFDPDDPDKHSFTETRPVRRLTGNSYGSPVYQDQNEETGRITVCGPCYAKQQPFRQTPAIPPGADPETYTEWLEEKAGLKQDTLPNDFPG